MQPIPLKDLIEEVKESLMTEPKTVRLLDHIFEPGSSLDYRCNACGRVKDEHPVTVTPRYYKDRIELVADPAPHPKPMWDDPGLEEVVRVAEEAHAHDPVNHPSHYTAYRGLEVIDLTEQMNFNRGNAVKYIARAGLKDPDSEIQDLEKASWYIKREIHRLKQVS